MKNVREPNGVDELLNAVLADADWHALNRSLKREALAVIGAGRRRRRARRWIGQATCVAFVLVGATWWLRSPAPTLAPVAGASGRPASPGTGEQFISEDQMLAMFPAGSCVVAEINGRKELVFFDAKQADEGFIVARIFQTENERSNYLFAK